MCNNHSKSIFELTEMTNTRDVIADSGLFDALFYDSSYKAYAKNMDPLDHYIQEGDALGFFPNSLFEPGLLRRLYPIPDFQNTLEYFILSLYSGRLTSIPSRWWQHENFSALPSTPTLTKTVIINGAYGTGRNYFNYLVQSQPSLLPYFRDCQQYCHPSKYPSINSTHAFFTVETPYSWSDLSDFIAPESAIRTEVTLISVVRHPVDCLISNWIWFFNLLKDNTPYTSIANSAFSEDSTLAEFISTHISSLEQFANGSTLEHVFEFLDYDNCHDHRLRGPCFLSFSTLLEEMKVGSNLAHFTFEFESFSHSLSSSLSQFYSSLGLDPNLIDTSFIQPPKAQAYRYKSLLILSEPLKRFVCRLSEEVGGTDLLGYSF